MPREIPILVNGLIVLLPVLEKFGKLYRPRRKIVRLALRQPA